MFVHVGPEGQTDRLGTRAHADGCGTGVPDKLAACGPPWYALFGQLIHLPLHKSIYTLYTVGSLSVALRLVESLDDFARQGLRLL